MRLTLSIAAAALAVVSTFACSSSDPPPAAEAEQKAAPTPAPAASETEEPAPAEGSYGTPGEENNGDMGASSSSGGAGMGDGGGGGGGNGGGGGTGECATNEAEGNDDAASANMHAVAKGSKKVFCGSIDAGQVDFMTFTLPADATSLSMELKLTAAGVTVEPTVDGQPFSFSGPYNFKGGGKYVLKITSTAKSDYKVGVDIK